MSRSIEDIRRDITAVEACRSEAGEQMDASQDGLFAERLVSLQAELQEAEQPQPSTMTDTGSVFY